MDLDKFSNVIFDVAKRENQILEELAGDGIFFMPELAFSYLCAQQIMKAKYDIFGEEDVRWQREINLGNGGPSDLVFCLPEERKVVIEFKMAQGYYDYLPDIEKLGKLNDPKTLKIFCALLDTFKDSLPDDGRQKRVTEIQGYEVAQVYQGHFPTKYSKYVAPISCVVALWTVNRT